MVRPLPSEREFSHVIQLAFGYIAIVSLGLAPRPLAAISLRAVIVMWALGLG